MVILVGCLLLLLLVVVVVVVAAAFVVVVFNAQELLRVQEVTLIHYGVNFFAQDTHWGWIH
jgi:hypothetical protein